MVGEVLFAAAFLLFVYIRLNNPDIWQPWFGGEKYMEFAFLNGILRSPNFPPVDPHFAGGFINYYYFGIYLVAFLIKLTGIYAEVAFNLAIPMLFALTVVHSYGAAYSAVWWPQGRGQRRRGGRSVSQRFTLPLGSGQAPRSHIPESASEPAAEGSLVQSDDVKYGAFDLTDDSTDSVALDSAENTVSQRLAEEAEWLAEGTSDAEGELDAADTLIAEQRDDDVASPNWTTASVAEDEHSEMVDDAGAPAKDGASTPLVPEQPWHHGLWVALLAPLFVTLIGNLDGLGQVVRHLANMGSSEFRSALPGLEYTIRAFDGLSNVMNEQAQLPGYNFWDPSRVIPATINEFPYWSFLFADLHPHLIGIPLSVLFLGLLLTLIYEAKTDWGQSWKRGLLLLGTFGLLLGVLASVNLWELPTYAGLGILGFIVCQYRGRGKVDWPLTVFVSIAYVGLAYLFFTPFFQNFTNVGASGIGLVREPDELGKWLLIWGFLGFVLLSWVFYAVGQKARDSYDGTSSHTRTSGLERMLSLGYRYFGRLPRLLYLHKLLVARPTLGYLAGLYLWPLGVLLGLLLWWRGYSVLALCLFFLMPAFLLLWRRGRAADAGDIFAALLAATGLAILAGTQVVYLKDFLQGGDWYRMNTLFKFFSQVWVIWGVAAAIALPRLWHGLMGRSEREIAEPEKMSMADIVASPQPAPIWLRTAWAAAFVVLLTSSLAYIAWGTPARLEQRFVGWQPEFGTLNGLDFMQQGVYTWPDASNPIELHYDWLAIQWLLENVEGNAVIVESDVVGYYREGGSRVASITGLSGLRGMHASEQRYGDDNGRRDGFHREFWSTPDPARTLEIIRDLHVSFIYVGQLEQYHHPDGVSKLETMAQSRQLVSIYENEKVVIYGVPDKLAQTNLRTEE